VTGSRHPLIDQGVAEMRRARWLRAGALGLALAALLSTGVIGLPVQHAAAETIDEGNITVDVTDGVEPTPRPAFTPPGPPPGRPPVNPPRPGPPVAADVTQATIPDPVGADEALGEDPAVAGGILAMSGLTATASPSIAIGNGYVTLDFVVRNTSATAFDSTARFWIDNAVGGRIVDVDDVAVAALEPDETRRVQVRIDGLGQHFVLHAHVTLTPPDTVEGVELDAITRDTTIAVPPLFVLSLVSGIGAASGLLWWLFSRRGLGLAVRLPGR
jgi:hypothetical protein